MKDRELSPTVACAIRTSTVRMAEPQHRIAPPGASTGQSIRSYSTSCIDQVKEVCLFYVSKCSGKYQNNISSARYVHQMAEEVVSLLAGVASEIKRNKSEPEVFQALLDEWNENFPPSLGAMGSPKAIATLVAKQSVELSDLKSALAKERDRRDKDVSEVLRSMEAQLQAYRNSVMSERRHQVIEEQQRAEKFENTLRDLQMAHKDQMDRSLQASHSELQQTKGTFEAQLQKSNSNVERLKMHIKSNEAHHKARTERIRSSKDRKIGKILAKYRVAQEKYYQLACTVQDDPSVLSNASFDDTTVGSLSRVDSLDLSDLDDDDSEDEEEDEVRVVADNTGKNAQTSATFNEHRNRGHEESKNNRDGVDSSSGERSTGRRRGDNGVQFVQQTASDKATGRPSSSPSGALPSAPSRVRVNAVKYDVKLAADIRIKHLLEQIDLLRNDGLASSATITALNAEIARLQGEIEIYLRRLKELETMNEAYRCSLAMKINVPTHLSSKDLPQPIAIVNRTRSANNNRDNKVLCHTPHFLDRADKKGCMSNHPAMSAYNTPGIF